MNKPVICLMGATATGKTDIAIGLRARFPVDIISVDSALVYRGMDIGTAKPSTELLAEHPHQLVDILDPEDSYSAGEFVVDARAAIDRCHAEGRIPLLAGGTMMYFRALTRGIADLPAANPAIRARIDADASERGWPALHAQLAAVDPLLAGRISENDGQRIQRALEVFEQSGIPLSEWQSRGPQEPAGEGLRFIKLGLLIEPRRRLHERIAERLKIMINNGLEDEVKTLMTRDALTAEHPSMRSVGYRQFWAYLAGRTDLKTASDKALFATRQLAKRQITWLRSETSLQTFDALESGTFDAISRTIAAETGANTTGP
ncbi:MAG: tRNA (adenosine(37)-N6)-dimethylallyltransferase MiaA [Pseudomonadota bacterium]